MTETVSLRMAYSLEAVPLQQLEGLLQCSICLETLKEPRTLPCFHSYCKSCLEKFVKNHRDKVQGMPRREINCPTCRSAFTLKPGDDVASMTPNHFICNMLEVMAVQDRVKGVPCSHCPGPSVGRCVTCEVFLCQKCLTDHSNYRGFNNHSVLSMDELSKPENQTKIRRKLNCQEHKNKVLKFYCETCEELICRYCMDFHHEKPNHYCLPAEKVATKQKQFLVSSCNALKLKLDHGNKVLKEILDVTQSLERVSKRVSREINRQKDDILKVVTQRLNEEARQLISQAEEIYHGKHHKLTQQKDDIKVYVGKLESCLYLSEGLLEKGTDQEILSSAKMIKENIERIQNETLKSMKPADDDKVRYKRSRIDYEQVSEIKYMGKVEDGGNSKNTNETLYAVEGKYMILIIHIWEWVDPTSW